LDFAVRRVERGDDDAVNRRLDIVRLPVVGIAGQFVSRHDRPAAARQDGDAVPGLLAAPHGAGARLLNRGLGEFAVGGFKLLQRDDVGLFARSQPIRLASRLFTSLMLKVAIFIGLLDFRKNPQP
jgi:hypothetical protein